MATIAVVAGTAIAAGAAAYSANSQANAAKAIAKRGIPTAIPPTVRENQFNFQTQDILNEERSVIENAVNSGNQIQPELYHALGLDPIYSSGDPNLDQLQSQADGYNKQLDDIDSQIASLRGSTVAKGRGRAKALAARTKQVAQLQKQRTELQRQQTAANDALGRAKTAPRTIIGFQPLDPNHIPDPTNSAGGGFAGALNEFNSHLDAALKGQNPIDPTLLHQFDVQEQQLRDHLREAYGPDYESSTGGAQALAQFDNQRAMAIANYNTNAIASYSNLAENRAAALSNLTTAKLGQLESPSKFEAGLGLELGNVAGSRIGEQDALSTDRARMGGLNVQAAGVRSQYDLLAAQQNGQMVAGLGKALGSGLVSSSGALGATLSSNNSNPSAGYSPSYDPNGPNLPGVSGTSDAAYGVDA